jgi:coenzyme F420 hydrogenase subunit beta
MNKGLKALETKVLDQSQCTGCGACLSLCPYLSSWQGRVVKLHDCDLPEGRCFSYCPRTDVDWNEIHRSVFGADYEDAALGPARRIVMARARDRYWKKRAQNGGVVSALTDLALAEGMIQAAVLTHRDAALLPRGRVVRRREEILACAGSGYVAGPTLEALNRGPWDGDERIGVVGLPCQVLALGRMKVSSLERRTPIERLALVIGLFCTWALAYEPFTAFLKERFGGRSIGKLDITPPPERLLHVRVEGEVRQVPLDEIRPFIRPGCRVCLDMTSEFSDLSVGAVEGKEGWNTVVIRTERGEELMKRAETVKVLETRALPDDQLSHLKEASILKKRRALTALKESKESYLTLPKKVIDEIFREAAP